MMRKAGVLLGLCMLLVLEAASAWADVYTITTGLSDQTAAEGGTVTYTVKIDHLPPAGETVEVQYSVGGGTAGASDYTLTSSAIVFSSSSSTSQSIVVSITDDADAEGDETFQVAINPTIIFTPPGSTATLDGSTSVTVTIPANDNAYTLTSTLMSETVPEGAGTLHYMVSISPAPAPGVTVSVPYATSNGSAVAPGDYTATSGTMTFTDTSALSFTIDVPITNDTDQESNETFTLTLGTPTVTPGNTATVSGNSSATITIRDNDYQINVTPTASVEVMDGSVTVQVMVLPSLAAGDEITVDYTTANGTAVAGSDFTSTSGLLTFNSSSVNPQSITIPILDDGSQGGPENFSLNLSNPVGTLGGASATFANSSSTITINDHSFTVNVGPANQSLAEDGGSMTFTVSLDRAPAGSETVSVQYATVDGTAHAGSDFTTASGSLTFNTGTGASQTVTVTISDDAIQELAEQFTLQLSSPSTNAIIGTATATGTINDDDYTATISDVSVNENAGTASVTVTLTPSVAGDSVQLSYSASDGTAHSGSDYTLASGTLTISSGSTGTISVAITDDSLVELAETFTVTIAAASPNVTVSDPTATVTINVDEKYSVSVNDPAPVQEANTSIPFEITISPAVQADHGGLVINLATANGSATAPADYDAITSGSVSFATGETSKTQDVTIFEDTIDEGVSEQFTLNLTGSSMADIVTITDASGTGTIMDTDYAITPTWNQHGTVSLESPAGSSIAITSGTPVAIVNNTPAVFTVTADYQIHSVLIDGSAPGGLSYITSTTPDDQHHTYTFTASTPSGAHTIAVLFDHQITMTANGPGTVQHTTGIGQFVSGGTADVIADHGGVESFAMTGGASCVTSLQVDGSPVGAFIDDNNNWAGETYTFTNVTDNHTLEADFGAAPEITVTIGADDGATGTADDAAIQGNGRWRAYASDATFTPGTLLGEGGHGATFTPSCDTQYVVIQFGAVDGWVKPNDIQLNLDYNFHDQTVEGLYDRNSHVLTIIANHGSVTSDPEGEPHVVAGRFLYPADAAVELTAISDPAWYFSLWQGDASGTTNPVTVIMDRDRTVEAVFVQGCQDADGDGYTTADLSGTGCTVSPQIDCNDADADVHPDATDICGDGIDQDCSGGDLSCGGLDHDDDGDGFTENQGDCNDANPNVHPGLYDDPATPEDEDCYDGAKLIGSEVTCSHPSDVPASAARKPAPPLLMFLLDDSGSMDWEFMTSENYQLFSSRYYVYYSPDSQRAYADNRLNATQRRNWKSQWSGYNRIFYNPQTAYTPWPKWEEIVGAASVRAHEEEYDPELGSFPDTAYASGFTHADMDRPRLNTYDSDAIINAMYHPGDASGSHANYEMDLNAEFTRVKSSGQQVMVTRDSASTGGSTHADAIGLSTNASLALTVGHTYAWYLANPANIPSIIFDNSDGSTIYTETGTWYDSGGDSSYEWENNDRYTDAAGRSAIWKLNLTSGQVGDYYVYVWVDEYNTRDDNALYTIFSYDQVSGELVSQTVRKDQSPTNSSGTPTTGARWIRLNDSPIHFQTTVAATDIIIPNAHYYVWLDTNGDGNYWNDLDSDGVKDPGEAEDANEKYLVTIPGSGYGLGSYNLRYYLFTDVNSDEIVSDGELRELTGTDIPAALIPQKFDASGNQITDPAQLAYVVRQDFADWFSFYRRRILTAKAAVGLTVADMRQLELGVHTINRTYHEPLVYMAEAESTEKTNYLRTIYNVRPAGYTPLRRGLDDVGRYFQRGNSINVSGTNYDDYTNLQTSEGLNPSGCSGDTSVFYDANKDVDADSCDDSGGECQRAYVIAMTDGYYNDGYSSSRIGNRDAGSIYPVMQDGASNSLADFAYYFYNTDLDPNLGDHVPPRDFDDASHQHLVTYTVSFGVFGYFNPSLFPDCLPACDTPGQDGCPEIGDLTVKTWTESGSRAVFSGTAPYSGTCPDWHNAIVQDSPKAVDDLFHASVNGRGEFFNAADPGELVEAMKSIKQLIDNQTGTAASVAVNSRKIESDTLLFQTIYDSSDWSGNLLAKCLDATGELAACDKVTCENSCNTSYLACVDLCTPGDPTCETVCLNARTACLTANGCASHQTCKQAKDACVDSCAGTATCEAACLTTESTCMDDPPEVKWSAAEQLALVAFDHRQIITNNGTDGVPFRWGSLTPAMKTMLANQEDLLEYLRGSAEFERRNDSGHVHNYRNRPATVLGDFINSEPYHYKNTSLGIDWVFAGGNDGMLHVFHGQTGAELFAYVPNAVFTNLDELAKESYTDAHHFYVDGYIEVKDLGSRVVLIGGLGKGGKGYFALDLTAAAASITTIESHAADIVLWEYTEPTQPEPAKSNLGYSFSRPAIVHSNDGSAPWILVFGNGYDSTNGRAVLFTLGLDGAGNIQWTQMIDTGAGNATPDCNGLATPAILYPHGDGTDDYLYAGDLLGNMWKFDLRDSSRANWDIYFNDGTNPQPLFVAKSNAGYRQPITMQPDVTQSCAAGVKGFLVAFGTGRLFDPEKDGTDMSVQSAYGIWDWSAAWEELGANPTDKFLGSFLPVGSPPTTACTTGCTTDRGNTLTAGTCIYDCLGNSECEAVCQEVYTTCVANCSAIRNLSNMPAILVDPTSAEYVALLRQTQVWGGGVNYASDGSISEQQYGATNEADYDEILRTLSANEIDWLRPADVTTFVADPTKAVKHVGWYFDLPGNGERIIRDMIILNHKLVYTTSIPSDSPCESGGVSNYFSVDVCTGGRTLTPFFDVNNDGIINSLDYINIGTEANPVYAAPSSIQVEGLAPAPTVVEVKNYMDRLYFPDNDGPPGGTKGTLIEGYGKAMQYWRELNWQ